MSNCHPPVDLRNPPVGFRVSLPVVVKCILRMFSISQSCKIVERHPYPKCWKGMFVLRYLLKVDPQIRCLWIVALSVRGLFPPSGSNLLSYEAKRKCNHIIGLILGMFSFFEFLWLLIPASSLKVRYFSFKGER